MSVENFTSNFVSFQVTEVAMVKRESFLEMKMKFDRYEPSVVIFIFISGGYSRGGYGGGYGGKSENELKYLTTN